MQKRRVVITGMGTINPCGNSTEEYWNSLIAGKSGVSKIHSFDVEKFSTKIAGLISNINLEDHFEKKELRRSSKFILYARIAAREALKDAGLNIDASNAESIGVEVGSGIGGLETLEEASKTLQAKGPARVSPFTVPYMIVDMASGMIAIETGAKGPNSASVSACASAAHSMGTSFRLIQNGEAKAMITGGSEAAICPIGLASFCAAKSLSTNNENPLKASKPFDKNRDGFVMGEGAGVLIFEELEHAKARGAKIYGEVIGCGSSGDAYHITAPAPEGEGASRALKSALKVSGIKPEQIDYINAHGTSTLLNDKNETHAIKTVFGNHAYNLAVSSTKSMTGHLLGAAAAIEVIATLKAIETSLIPPTINLETPDPECDLDYTPNTPKKRDINHALSNSFGFGGHNAVVVVKKYQS